MQATVWPSLRRGLIAILRGVRPSEVVSVVAAIVDEGFDAVEIPLNSPDPFDSIRLAADAFADRCLIRGHGADVARRRRAGRERWTTDGVPQCPRERDNAGKRPETGLDARRLHGKRSAACARRRRVGAEVLFPRQYLAHPGWRRSAPFFHRARSSALSVGSPRPPLRVTRRSGFRFSGSRRASIDPATPPRPCAIGLAP
jgi:hypothetical protein